jgi:hypothetical protein
MPAVVAIIKLSKKLFRCGKLLALNTSPPQLLQT